MPKKPGDLTAHECVVHEGYTTSYNWEFREEETAQSVNVTSRLVVNSGEAAVVAAAAGAGVARVLSYLIDQPLKSCTVVKLLEGYEPQPTPVSVIYPSQRQVPQKLRAFLDFSIPRLRKRLGYKNS